jgi:hypothetical protein
MFFSRRRTNKCQNLGFPKGEDFWLKSGLEGKKSVLLITGSTPLFSKKLPIQMPI